MRRFLIALGGITILVLSIVAGLAANNYFGGSAANHFGTMTATIIALERDGRFVAAEAGLSYEFDSNTSGILPTQETINGVPARVSNFVFYAYGNRTTSVCGLWNSPNVLGELEIRVPLTSEGYDIKSVVIYHYSPPFVYLCQEPPVSRLDATRLEFHIAVNYSRSWAGYYGYSRDSSVNQANAKPWGGKGPATITVTAIGDIYLGVFVCFGVQKSDQDGGNVTLTLLSFNRDVTANSTASSNMVTLCGGNKVIFPG